MIFQLYVYCRFGSETVLWGCLRSHGVFEQHFPQSRWGPSSKCREKEGPRDVGSSAGLSERGGDGTGLRLVVGAWSV